MPTPAPPLRDLSARSLLAGSVVLSLGLVACSAYDPKLLGDRDAALDAAGSDSALPDADVDDAGNDDASSGNGCVPSDRELCAEICPETCNARDDDCDERIDEGGEVVCDLTDAASVCEQGVCLIVSCLNGAADCDGDPTTGCEASLDQPDNCGFCGRACDIPGASALCAESTCLFATCLPTFGDCDGNPTNGCEVRVDTLTHCGACRVACGAVANGQPGCVDGMCGIAECDPGFGDCDGNALNGCEVALNLPAACGTCTTTCAYDHASPLCVGSNCAPGACLSGYGDCDGDATNNCEANLLTDLDNCGVCGRSCDPQSAGGFACVGGQCVVSQCAVGLADCDDDANNGCETSLRTLTDCNGCGIPCQFANGNASCATGTCALAACQPGYGNCDNDATDGCETQLNTDSNCGACGTLCGVSDSRTCSGGICSLVACPNGSADCDNDGLSCEQSLSTLLHCAACNSRCGDLNGRLANATASCSSATCTVGTCDTNFGNCDGSASNGCEISLQTTANCGACGTACSRANAAASCPGGSCTLGNCNTGFANCDNNPTNGCETPTNTNNNCGACGTVCSRTNAVASCASGSCATVACNTGFGDCDGNANNGCETPINSLTHCGACNTACALTNATESCSAGACSLTACDSGYGNCDGSASNGCEAALNNTNNCGACGSLCDYANATEMCPGGFCTLTACNTGFASCDNDPANGCEQPLTTTNHCGGCNIACSRTNATAMCGGGVCAVGACNSGFGNCDGSDANGCETPLNTPENCGACGAACGKRKRLTISASDTDGAMGAHTNFPVLVRITGTNFIEIEDDVDVNGFDLRFTSDAGGITNLRFERVRYNETSDELIAWVAMDVVDAGQDFYVVYGEGDLSDKSSNTTWSNGYDAAWHLENVASIADSSGQGKTGTNQGATNSTNGIAGGAASFNGSSQYISVSPFTSIDGGTFSVSAWVIRDTSNTYDYILSQGDTGGTRQAFHWGLKHQNDGGQFRFAFYGDDLHSTSAFNETGSYVFWAGTFDAASRARVQYRNGVAVGSDTAVGLMNTTGAFDIGRQTFTNIDHWDGTIDEVRVSSVVRSANWIRTEFNNQRPGSTFLTIGPEGP